jgi:hypothetical protein
MVNTRLPVIDLVGGDQPLGDEHGRYWVMQNGEIYNYVELRAELEALGHRFETSSDTEVIVHAYETWGTACLDRLNGEFAFAVWDRLDRELFLARDRFGVRPLFVSEAGGDLSFASEAKALLRHPGATRRLDPLGLVDTFTMWSTLPDRSAFEGIRELAPGHFLRWGPGGLLEERRWWDLSFDDGLPARPEEELAEELRELLRDATRIRLRADVPVAAYLAGIDSSLVVAPARDPGDDVTSWRGFGRAPRGGCHPRRGAHSRFRGSRSTRRTSPARPRSSSCRKPALERRAPPAAAPGAVRDAGSGRSRASADEMPPGTTCSRTGSPLLGCHPSGVAGHATVRLSVPGRRPRTGGAVLCLRPRSHRDRRPACQPPHPVRGTPEPRLFPRCCGHGAMGTRPRASRRPAPTSAPGPARSRPVLEVGRAEEYASQGDRMPWARRPGTLPRPRVADLPAPPAG